MIKKYMAEAIKNARCAKMKGEVPVGCVIVKNDRIIAEAANCVIEKNDATSHAEIEAIKQACEKLKTQNLKDCELYVTLEPCPMCAGAIINAKISTLVFGAIDTRYGAFGGYINLASHTYASSLTVYGGICEEECSEMIKNFFEMIRK